MIKRSIKSSSPCIYRGACDDDDDKLMAFVVIYGVERSCVGPGP